MAGVAHIPTIVINRGLQYMREQLDKDRDPWQEVMDMFLPPDERSPRFTASLSWTAGTNATINEAAIFSTTGQVVARTTFPAINLETNDSIEITMDLKTQEYAIRTSFGRTV